MNASLLPKCTQWAILDWKEKTIIEDIIGKIGEIRHAVEDTVVPMVNFLILIMALWSYETHREGKAKCQPLKNWGERFAGLLCSILANFPQAGNYLKIQNLENWWRIWAPGRLVLEPSTSPWKPSAVLLPLSDAKCVTPGKESIIRPRKKWFLFKGRSGGYQSWSRQHTLRPDARGLLLPKQNNSNQNKTNMLYGLIFIFTGFGRRRKVWNGGPFGELCIY